MKSVFDTVILVRGLINPYSLCGRLVFDHSGSYELIASPAIVVEYLSVVHRPELVRKYHEIETRDLTAVLDIIANATIVRPEDTPAICRDPADDKLLAAAQTGSAPFIVTEDLDLLDLSRYEGIQIVTAGAFLRILEKSGDGRG